MALKISPLQSYRTSSKHLLTAGLFAARAAVKGLTETTFSFASGVIGSLTGSKAADIVIEEMGVKPKHP